MPALTDSAAAVLPLLAESPLDLSRLTDAFARYPDLTSAVLTGASNPAAAIVLMGAARLRARLLAVAAACPANAAR